MKYLKLTIYIFTLLLALTTANHVHAATEFVSIIDSDNAVGADYTNLSTWASACERDLTSASASVFSYSTASDAIKKNSCS